MAKKQANSMITALYERLSKDDEQQGESNSITNQKQYLEDYAIKNGYLNIRHFTDDGYTGRNFNRPGFEDLIKEIEAGNVETLIVKDMSRLGRDYLQVGFYTEIVFPNNNVHFIAINNSVDSERQSDNDFTPFLNIMNEWYAKDTSNKIKSIFNARMEDGKRCSGSIPYGYNRLSGDKQTLVVDPIASQVVRRIFELADEGNGPTAIAKILSEDKVLIPAAYTAKYHPEQNNGRTFYSPYSWSNSTVAGILDRQEYLGHTVLKKTICTNFKTNKRRFSNEEELLIFENTHEPIISQELWDSVQNKRVRCPRTTPNGTYKHRLSGYLFCSDCGSRLTLQTHKKRNSDERYYTFRCGNYKKKGQECTGHYISADAIEELLLISLQRLSKYVIENEDEFAKQLREQKKIIDESKPNKSKAELNKLEKRYDELNGYSRGLYENFIAGIISERQYRNLSNEYDLELDEIEGKMDALKKSLEEDKSKPVQIEKFIKLIHKYKNPEELTDEMLKDFIDKVVVHDAEGRGKDRTQVVEIYYNFIGEFDLPYSAEEIEAAEKAVEEEKNKKLEERRAKKRERSRKQNELKKAERYAQNEGHKFAKRVCECCGKEYWPNSAGQKYCSKECSKKANMDRIYRKRQEEKGDHTFRKKVCVVCGKEFWPKSGGQVTCSEECRDIKARERAKTFYEENRENVLEQHKAERDARHQKLMEENEGHLIPKRVCEYCGKEYWPTKQHQKYCCNECGKKAYEMTDKGRDPKEKEGHKFYKRTCVVCGKEFWPSGPNTICCSDECKKEREKNRHILYSLATKANVNLNKSV